MVWTAGRKLTIAMATISVMAGLLPAAIAYFSALLVDTIVHAHSSGYTPVVRDRVLMLIGIEASLLVASSLVGKVNGHLSSLLSDELVEQTKIKILKKSIELDYEYFENSEFCEMLVQARNDPERPLGIVVTWLGLAQIVLTLGTSTILLAKYSLWSAIILAVAAIPGFFVGLRMTRQSYAIHQRHVSEGRRQGYIERILTHDGHAKELRTYGFGYILLDRYREKVRELARERRVLAISQSFTSTGVEFLSTAVLYIAYGIVAISAASGAISVGQMTMYLQLFRQAQGSVSGMLETINSIYAGRLYIQPLFKFLDLNPMGIVGTEKSGSIPGDGIRFEGVSFYYPGSKVAAINNLSVHIPAGQAVALVGDNGAGKSTMVKLISRLYRPSSGTIKLDGLDINQWDEETYRRRISALFQDYKCYMLKVGENIGFGDVAAFNDEERWMIAAKDGFIHDVLEALPEKYHTQMGASFDGIELSGGQWQKVALARTYMREGADIVILDEPSAAIDSVSEAKLLEAFKKLMLNRTSILISHRFSTVRLADRVLVLGHGEMIEDGTHAQLIQNQGHYANMYALQSEGYK